MSANTEQIFLQLLSPLFFLVGLVALANNSSIAVGWIIAALLAWLIWSVNDLRRILLERK